MKTGRFQTIPSPLSLGFFSKMTNRKGRRRDKSKPKLLRATSGFFEADVRLSSMIAQGLEPMRFPNRDVMGNNDSCGPNFSTKFYKGLQLTKGIVASRKAQEELCG